MNGTNIQQRFHLMPKGNRSDGDFVERRQNPFNRSWSIHSKLN